MKDVFLSIEVLMYDKILDRKVLNGNVFIIVMYIICKIEIIFIMIWFNDLMFVVLECLVEMSKSEDVEEYL